MRGFEEKGSHVWLVRFLVGSLGDRKIACLEEEEPCLARELESVRFDTRYGKSIPLE